MQLSLFDDNKAQILLSCLDDCLQQLDLDRAVTILDQLQEECPDETSTPALRQIVSDWTALLHDPAIDWQHPEHLHRIWQQSAGIPHVLFKNTVVAYIIDCLLALPNLHGIYIPPRFHIGPLLLDMGRLQEAALHLESSLGQTTIPRGRLFVWYANALALLKRGEDSLPWYLAACLLDPINVPLDALSNRNVKDLLNSLQAEADGEIEESDEAAWLPVWGVLQGMFSLPFSSETLEVLLDGRQLAEVAGDDSLPVPRHWFYLLLQAEAERACQADTGPCRRMMKNLNHFMLRCYLERMVTGRHRSPA